MALLLIGASPWISAAEEDAELKQLRQQAEGVFKKDVAPFVREFCMECHGNRRTKGGINFEPALKAPGGASASKKWPKAFANVNAHDMPPEKADQPNDEERERFLDGLASLKYLSERDPGPFVIRRLTKMEYGNTLHDLLGVDASVADELPDEVAGAGYLNSLSPMQTEQYLSIANAALDQVLGPADHPVKTLPASLRSGASETEPISREQAEKWVRHFGRSAFRRPVTDEEVATLLRVYDLGISHKLTPMAALRLMVKAVLVSPQFLFITPAQTVAKGQKIVPLDDYQLAARLSYLLWATLPDAELAALADAGKLQDPAVLRAQTQRLLEDPRSRALFDGFGAQWLRLGELKDKLFDAAKFPQMTDALRLAMYDEARCFFDRLVRENLGVEELLSGKTTFLNAPLAAHYGVAGVKGSEMQPVVLRDARRGGLLGMAGILAATSFPNRTSPVKRGVWVLEQLLGEQVPPAPPNVPALEKQDQKKVAHLTLRQRTELHRTDPVCANCHKILDPIGFGLENFDAIGQWRDVDDGGGKIDAAGVLPSGETFATPQDLKALLTSRRDDVARNLVEQLLGYALCRQLGGYDEVVVDQLMRGLEGEGYRMKDLITAVVTSYPFRHRRIAE
ncbi:MAG: DUF1592 domain-containing protein [Verrucomicrobiales bacterium]|nr:DUF1592 domain-containing protein [Verrucomicrobiales bacterium]